MRFLNYLAMLLVTSFLVACGGGGGAPGLPSGTAKPLTTTAPATLNIGIGASYQYNIVGGKAPYVISSSVPDVALGWIAGSSFSVGGLTAGTATLTVLDATGLKADIALTVNSGPVVALYITAPSPLTMAPTTAQTFTIGGGRPPYLVESDDVSKLMVALNPDGTTLKFSALVTGSANVKVTDALGATISTGVNVASSGVALSVSPTTASTFVNMPVKVVVVGGTPPYRVAGLIPSAVTAVFDPVETNQLLVTPLLVSSGLDVTILDSQNASTKFTLTSIAGQPTIRLSPSALIVAEKTSQSIVLTSFGAVGPLVAFSSDVTLFTTSVSGGSITATQLVKCVATDTPVTITVVDSNRAVATSVITVADNGNATGTDNCPP